jgi:nicotinamidase-related amidase
MSLTTLDSIAALIVVDLQNGIVALPTAHPTADVVDKSARLARAFRARGLPVVLVNVVGGAPGRIDAKSNFKPEGDWTSLVPELDAQAADHRVTKKTWGAFTHTDLDAFLRGKNVTQVFITGVATTSGVESTARSAYELGYNVVTVIDAMTDMNGAAHDHSVKTVFPRLSELTTTADVLTTLGKN